jgi:hypothetical protein
MTLAMKKLKNFGWVALLSVSIVLLYPMSLNVGALHSELVSTDRKIMETKREISFLQAELKTRANMAQLAEWNDLLYGYGPPTADQFLAGERALANLGGIGPDVKPVMVAVSDMDGIVPAGEIGKPGGFASKLAEDEGEPMRIAVAVVQKPKLPETVAAAKPVGRTERLSKMDDQLLSDKTLKEIEKKAAQERNRR